MPRVSVPSILMLTGLVSSVYAFYRSKTDKNLQFWYEFNSKNLETEKREKLRRAVQNFVREDRVHGPTVQLTQTMITMDVYSFISGFVVGGFWGLQGSGFRALSNSKLLRVMFGGTALATSLRVIPDTYLAWKVDPQKAQEANAALLEYLKQNPSWNMKEKAFVENQEEEIKKE